MTKVDDAGAALLYPLGMLLGGRGGENELSVIVHKALQCDLVACCNCGGREANVCVDVSLGC